MDNNFYPGDIAQYFSVIHRAFLRDTREAYQKLQLNATSAYILVLLCKKGAQSQNDISKTLLISKGQIAREIKRLKTMNYVTQEVSAYNRTRNNIALTEQGRNILLQIENIRNAWWQKQIIENQLTDQALFEPTLKQITQRLIQSSKKEH